MLSTVSSYLSLALVVSLLGFLLWVMSKSQQRTHQTVIEDMKNLIQDLRHQNLDLLNRLMSQDLQTYNTMTAVSKTSSTEFNDSYIPRNDESELSRLVEFAKGQGLGDLNLEDEEYRGMLQDFGLNVNLERE